MKRKCFHTGQRLLLGCMLMVHTGFGQVSPPPSVARQWNEVLLDAIRNDFARPTVHARNLFHTSIALYDAWAAYDQTATPFLLGKTVKGFYCSFEGMTTPRDVKAAREETMSYAAYRLLQHRFQSAPGGVRSLQSFDQLMTNLGYDIAFTSEDYSAGSAAALGNYIAQRLIDFGLQDGSNEALDYKNQSYEPVNPPLRAASAGTQGLTYPNRWQPLSFSTFEDQAGFELPERVPAFLSPEWGRVVPFALRSDDLTIYRRNGHEYWVYHDPGMPAFIQQDGANVSADYQWGNSLAAIWSSHLDPSDGVMWDISPASIGNIPSLPTTLADHRDFYDRYQGGDVSKGHPLNPNTGEPYPPQWVPRGDYTRVLAEFWADGPDSETPPGHWFTILNYVNDHPSLVKRFKGEGDGDILDNLEWDVKAYFVLGGAIHDAAICAWGSKGWYDCIRPISAIRYLAEQGQSSDPALPNYAPNGMPLEEGLIELVQPGDSLAGDQNEQVGNIKLYAWRGPEYIDDPQHDWAGTGWILAENWMPYQRPNFVTPPFAGYVSGHSTFSRAAAEVMTLLTGDAFFPGGIGEFLAKKNEFLVFEEGPSVDVLLQWATYRDAADQCSLSRIWGGIHPPVDDMPGRIIGGKVGQDAFALAEQYFQGDIVTSLAGIPENTEKVNVYPNPLTNGWLMVDTEGHARGTIKLQLLTLEGKTILSKTFQPAEILKLNVRSVPSGMYLLTLAEGNQMKFQRIIIE